MNIKEQISAYISNHPIQKREDLEVLHQLILQINPDAQLWFLDGKNEEGKTVSNPNIGYGVLKLHYKDGSSRDFYQLGISTNTTGISIYVIGINDKNYLSENFAETIGKASVTGYCIKFKKLKDISLEVLEKKIQFGFEPKS
ncbi:DUF1801 domain-containing protein [Chryseobacterium sp.]|uniref:DUF1801 domain-containing protein n=1 Tax=Chryseobacterium sp. TaxID=1871047 RepID=UPI00289AD4C3|nr:DUF1801 domain-containing protein [Chryseobacterium sp.]